ncbi:GNAT family N-acetyltransferase [Flavilitoribacter nigricans]|uniref:GNAT family N-acetyltransferase n=1 Tax=Flavilitoribacter nigricans (strain ATCC 23147 / DSM 23189 / NBRC 102662 / NCIMB 1420 / SS-2) TaxID=1122177 RepID=A0A2D0NAB5_FLAN2|nr:GNAT family N-acetyltransferase [Flavilitoribacter nigricans]PHN04723.1 GNAT family N-acetyltransferase [Flavilitoribacter nigricans DSM 23189 = NBRC 102662]
MSIQIKAFTGLAGNTYIPALARLRIEIFREFPYLYDGDMAYEEAYLKTFFAAPDSLIVVAFDQDQIVGASTGMPLEHETENIKSPWRAAGHDPARIFYYGESVLRHSYRGQGIGVRFFEEREKWARQLGRFERLTFCAVIRPDDHPLRPKSYTPLHDFWHRRGFGKVEGMSCTMDWKDLDAPEETSKSLQFWQKSL